MTRKIGSRAVFAMVLAAATITTAGALPAQARSPAGKLGNEFRYTYYSSAAHTGTPVGGWTYGYCPSYFSTSWGTRTSYFIMSEEAC